MGRHTISCPSTSHCRCHPHTCAGYNDDTEYNPAVTLGGVCPTIAIPLLGLTYPNHFLILKITTTGQHSTHIIFETQLH